MSASLCCGGRGDYDIYLSIYLSLPLTTRLFLAAGGGLRAVSVKLSWCRKVGGETNAGRPRRGRMGTHYLVAYVIRLSLGKLLVNLLHVSGQTD